MTRFLKGMSFEGYIRGFHMTCGSKGPQVHCHVIAFYYGAPPTEVKCTAVWGGRMDVKTTNNSAEEAASMFAYLFKRYQPSEGEDVRMIPEASKLLKSLRVAKSGKAIKWAFRETNASAGRLLE